MPNMNSTMPNMNNAPIIITRTKGQAHRRGRPEMMAVMTSEPFVDFRDDILPEEINNIATIITHDIETYLPVKRGTWSGNRTVNVLPTKTEVEAAISKGLTKEFQGLPVNSLVRSAMENRTAIMVNDLIARGRLNANVPRFAVDLRLDPITQQARISINDSLFDPFVSGSQPIRWNGTIWVPDKKQELKDKIRKQLNPIILNHRGASVRATRVNFNNSKENELVALNLLRQMVLPEAFKKYLKYGFVTIQGSSGLTYQITRKSHLIGVWENGHKLAILCIYLKDSNIPPTDEFIAKMLICECDEQDIWKRANVSWKAVQEAKNSNRIQILGIVLFILGIMLPLQSVG